MLSGVNGGGFGGPMPGLGFPPNLGGLPGFPGGPRPPGFREDAILSKSVYAIFFAGNQAYDMRSIEARHFLTDKSVGTGFPGRHIWILVRNKGHATIRIGTEEGVICRNSYEEWISCTFPFK